MADLAIQEPAFFLEDANWRDPLAKGKAGMLRLTQDELRFTDFNDRVQFQTSPQNIDELTARWAHVTFLELVLATPLKGFSRTVRFRMSNRALDFARSLADAMPEESPYFELKEAPETPIFVKWARALTGRRGMSFTEVFKEEKLWASWLMTIAVPVAILMLLGLAAHLFLARFADPADPLVARLIQRRVFLYVVPLFGLVLTFGPATIDFLASVALGGQGDFLTHLYTRTLFQIPLLALTITAVLATSTTYLACLGPFVGLILFLYTCYLVGASNKAVHQLGGGRAFLTVIAFLVVEVALGWLLANDFALLLM